MLKMTKVLWETPYLWTVLPLVVLLSFLFLAKVVGYLCLSKKERWQRRYDQKLKRYFFFS